jgi:hypothetical protein
MRLADQTCHKPIAFRNGRSCRYKRAAAGCWSR